MLKNKNKRRYNKGTGAIGLFILLGFALFNCDNADAKEKNLDFWKNIAHVKQIKENVIDDAIPDTVIKYANNNYKSLLQAASHYDTNIGKNLFKTSLGDPFVILSESNEEVYYFPVITENKVIYVISVINTSDGLTMSGSYELVNIINDKMNDSTLIIYDENETIRTYDVTDSEYEEIVEQTSEYLDNMSTVNLDKIHKKNAKKEEYTPSYSYNVTSGNVTGKICRTYNFKSQGSLPICWAASVATIVNYMNGTNISAKQVCNDMNLPYKGKDIYIKQKALCLYGLIFTKTDAQLSWSQIKDNINKKSLIAASTFAESGGGHAITIHGYKYYAPVSEKYIYFWNSGNSSVEVAIYKTAGTTYTYNGKTFTWTRTLSKYK